MENKEQFEMIVGKYTKVLTVKDMEDKNVELYLCYPRMKDSQLFWDAIITLTETFDQVKKSKLTMENITEDDMAASGELLSTASKAMPTIAKYIISNIESIKKVTLTDEEQDYYYLVTVRNMNLVIVEFTRLFSNLFSTNVADSNKP